MTVLGDNMRRLFASALLVATIATITACTEGPPDGPPAPGLKSGTLGGVEVVGYLGAKQAKGSSWTVYTTKPGVSSEPQPVALAVLEPGSVDDKGIEALEGHYIWAAGRKSGGQQDEAVPRIRVDGIGFAVEPLSE